MASIGLNEPLFRMSGSLFDPGIFQWSLREGTFLFGQEVLIPIRLFQIHWNNSSRRHISRTEAS